MGLEVADCSAMGSPTSCLLICRNNIAPMMSAVVWGPGDPMVAQSFKLWLISEPFVSIGWLFALPLLSVVKNTESYFYQLLSGGSGVPKLVFLTFF